MKTNCKNILKAVLFSFVVNLLLVIVMLFYTHNIVSDIKSLVLTFGILTVSCILYSGIKGDTVNSLLYNIVSILSHMVFIALTLLILSYFYKGWETAMFLWIEMFSLFAYSVAVIIDSIARYVDKIRK